MVNRERTIIVLGIVSAIASVVIGVARTATVSELPEKKPDYERLSKMLAARAFEKADRQTYRIMLMVLRKYPDRLSKSVYLTEDDIANFPCEDLLRIDEVWHQYTRGKFSFRTQQQIWMNLQQSQVSKTLNFSKFFEDFAQQVNWKVAQGWKSYEELTFDLQAKPGHLPALASGGSVTTTVQNNDLNQKTDTPLWGFNVNCIRENQEGQLIRCTPNLSPAIFSRLASCQLKM
ncbi:GUN4 domain-containing protein [Capilliphycus salinus ALCB114379]|uniref:GUN4 domain-containing protein n=1 Tax=Capilliphycus salinus TaxID=2768948 RepID=UPI0039A4E4A6